MAVYTIREYDVTYYEGDAYAAIRVNSGKRSNEHFSSVPTEAEVNAVLGTQDIILSAPFVFSGCTNIKAAPKLPDYARLQNGSTTNGLFYGCSNLEIAPKLPTGFYGTPKSLRATFRDCSKLIQAPVIPSEAVYLNYMFRDAVELAAPVSIPQNATYTPYMYYGATKVTGEMVVRGTLTSYSSMFYGTTKPITLYGDQTLCASLAATANNGNVSWSPWYDPAPAVTDRGQGSYTTAEDMTRMVRNGALAVGSYAPGRMVYRQGDIVRADEWEALVEAAQTIDPTVTLSTHYANLNKIEKAFDSAL